MSNHDSYSDTRSCRNRALNEARRDDWVASRKLILKPGAQQIGDIRVHTGCRSCAAMGTVFPIRYAEKMTCEYLTAPSCLESPIFVAAIPSLRRVVS